MLALLCVRAGVLVFGVWVLMYAYHLHINYAHWTINQNFQALCSCSRSRSSPGCRPFCQHMHLSSARPRAGAWAPPPPSLKTPISPPWYSTQLSLIGGHGGDSLSSDLHKSSPDSLQTQRPELSLEPENPFPRTPGWLGNGTH